jgi:hypothetical protein
MPIKDQKKLPADIHMRCYACEDLRATHVFRIQLDDLMVQVCLCSDCMKMDTRHLIKNTTGIESSNTTAVNDYLLP